MSGNHLKNAIFVCSHQTTTTDKGTYPGAAHYDAIAELVTPELLHSGRVLTKKRNEKKNLAGYEIDRVGWTDVEQPIQEKLVFHFSFPEIDGEG